MYIDLLSSLLQNDRPTGGGTGGQAYRHTDTALGDDRL
jgi:hypothetical protein